MQDILREYQREAISQARASLSKHDRCCLKLPTGAGKTVIAAAICQLATDAKRRVAFSVPSLSLIDQTVARFAQFGMTDVGVIQGNHPLHRPSASIQVCSIQTVGRRGFPEADLLIVDECHVRFAAMDEWARRQKTVGLTATPWAKGMGDLWQDLVAPISMRALIDEGRLVPALIKVPSLRPEIADMKLKRQAHGMDYDPQALKELAPKLVGDVIQTWSENAQGLPTLVFAIDRKHARALQDAFEAAGFQAGYCDADVDRVERERLGQLLAEGALDVIVNIATLTTGVDWDIRCIVLARPTKSPILFQQILGRGLRPAPGKTHCLVLDHTTSALDLGTPEEIDAAGNYLDEKAPPKTREQERQRPVCPSCQTLWKRGADKCGECGHVPEKRLLKQAQAWVEGELVELKPKQRQGYSREDKQRFYQELWWVRRERNYSDGWVANTYRAKFGVWPQGLDRSARPASDQTRAFVQSQLIRFSRRAG